MNKKINVLGTTNGINGKTLYGTYSKTPKELPTNESPEIHKYSTHKEVCDFFKIPLLN